MSPGAHRQNRLPRPTKRSFALLILALIVAICGVIDQNAQPVNHVAAANIGVGAAPASAVSSAWYCPLLLNNDKSVAPTTSGAVEILNPLNQALTGTITFVDNTGASKDVTVTVAARTRQSFSTISAVSGPYASALVRLAGGGASVEQFAHTPTGDVATPCSSDTSQHWYFADGSTEAGASTEIGLFNPFSEDAIADVTFATDEGAAQPSIFEAIPIPAMKMVLLDVSGNVRRRGYVATTISLRVGRAAAAEIQTGTFKGAPVAAYTLGQPDLSTNAYVPDIQTTAGRRTSLSLYNPNDVESDVEINNLFDSGSAPAFEQHIPARSQVSVDFDTEQRIAANSHLGAVVNVKNGVPIATQLSVSGVTPAQTTGGDFSTPPTQLAKRWIAVSGSVDNNSDANIFVLNPSSSTATIQVRLTGDGNESVQPPIRLGPGKRYILHVNDLSPNAAASVVVESDQDVAVSREMDVAPGPNLSLATLIPIRQ